MPKGGGVWTIIGNTVSILGLGFTDIHGFCDGPHGSLWATVDNGVGNDGYFIEFTSGQLVMPF